MDSGIEEAKTNNDSTFQLYSSTTALFEDDNMFFSPLSIEIAFAMVCQGAAGETAEKLSEALNVKDSESAADKYKRIIEQLDSIEDITVQMANRIYLMEGFSLKAKFEKAINEYFKSEVTLADFSQNEIVAKEINDWVEEKTKEKIKNLISSGDLNSDIRVVLINAIYFMGNWENPFEKEKTEEDLFYISEDDGIYCQMMYIKRDFNYCYSLDSLDASIVELPYRGGNASMIIVLPHEIEGLAQVEKQLADIDLCSLTDSTYTDNIEVYLPKFKIETTIDLEPVLTKMGLSTIFTSAADLSETVENCQNLFVSKAIHKAFLEVNEEGCEAAAATGVLEMFMSGPSQFRADHPFLFFIKTCGNETNTVLFMGKVLKPEY